MNSRREKKRPRDRARVKPAALAVSDPRREETAAASRGRS